MSKVPFLILLSYFLYSYFYSIGYYSHAYTY
jgi:hypothetical protein